MSDSIANFIKVQRILNDNDSVNAKVQSETININDIKGFRSWHKGKNDAHIKGDITLVVMKSTIKIKDSEERKPQTILINEKYEDFEERISQRTTIK